MNRYPIEKGSALILGLACICVSFLMLCIITEEVDAQTITVDNTGGADYTTIKEALSYATSGDTIIVNYGDGTYEEDNPITISISVNIIGQLNEYSETPTILAQNSNQNVISINSGYPTLIESFTITGATGNGCSGIYSQVQAESGNEVVVQDCFITGNYFGVTLSTTSSYNVIDDSYIYSNSNNAINFDGSDHTISNCGSTFQSNTGIYSNGGHGIYSTTIEDSLIEDSNIYDNIQKGIYLTNSISNTLNNIEVWNNEGCGIEICGNYNTIDGYGNRNIIDNYYGSEESPLSDVVINGCGNTFEKYSITQTDGDISDRYGITTINTDSDHPNIINDCHVYNYGGTGSVGISLDGGDDISGPLTKINDNSVGVIAGDSSYNSEIDCDNTEFSIDSYNFYDNDISIQVNCDNCIIKETFFNYTGYSPTTYIGILIDNSYSANVDADIDTCLFEKIDIGIKIIQSDNDYHSSIYGCIFNTMSTAGIYIEDSYIASQEDSCDYIERCTFSYSDTGIYLDDSSGIDIYCCTFLNNGDLESGIDAGIYTYSIYWCVIENCLFDQNVKGIWLGLLSDYTTIYNCIFKDGNNKNIGDIWGENTCEIGVYLHWLANYNLIDTCDFYNLSYAIGIDGCNDTSIMGDSEYDSVISNCGYGLYAGYYGGWTSTGKIYDYGDDITVHLEGYSQYSKTVFKYKSLGGSVPNPTGEYCYWALDG